jgi:hypothetical protein
MTHNDGAGEVTMSVDDLLLNQQTKARARQRAYRRLADLHDEEFQQILEREMDRARREEAAIAQAEAAMIDGGDA